MTAIRPSNGRHLSIDVFDQFLKSRVPWERHIEGTPRMTLFIDPARPAMGLRIPTREEVPETGLEHVRAQEIVVRGVSQIEVAVTHSRFFLDAYPLFIAIADRIQVDGMSLGIALSDTLKMLGRLLERREQLPEEVEIGLFGELLLLQGLGRHVGYEKAIVGWRGPFASDHDFGVEGVDIEVKTTKSKRRTHWVSSLTQLVPNPNRPLYMVSFQLETAGSDDGKTLPELIDGLITNIPNARLQNAFDLRMGVTAWRDKYEAMSLSRWRIKADPAAFAVTEGFPRITPNHIVQAGIDISQIPDIRYRIDLTGYPTTSPIPPFLAKALSERAAP